MEDIKTSSTRQRDFLIRERKRRKLSQEEVAGYLNIHRTAYANIERGDRDPSLKTALALSDFFGIDIRMLNK